MQPNPTMCDAGTSPTCGPRSAANPSTCTSSSMFGAARSSGGALKDARLEDLGVSRSLSRPQVSNDNPFVESTSRTVEGHPCFPDRPFGSLEGAIAWVSGFVAWYNQEHRHSCISFATPAQRHTRRHQRLLDHRDEVYAAAKDQIWLSQLQ